MAKVRKTHTQAESDLFLAEAEKLCRHLPEEYCAPILARDLNALHIRLFGKDMDYSQEKVAFNSVLLALYPQCEQRVLGAKDPLYEAIRLAMAANYIDFAQLTSYDEGAIDTVFAAADRATVDKALLQDLKTQLSTAKTLCYLHDNCGEIVLDKLLIATIKRQYPQIIVTSVVRGGNVINDVTLADANQVQLGEVANVIGNGSNVAGTYLAEVNAQTLALMQTSDMIISKGLGNVETLIDEDIPVWYLFMAKCSRMAERFGVSLMETVLYRKG